ncbi:VanZ family protein [Arthrobacter sp. ISL-5]|uniref:VanZ family protein n=1 Tax=Arthrobacter sp. ISL-5 TaxID=2819111 RepID=UPI001BEAD3FD|nr:VanZ family protein [Arthrobacter sp. ISL-5]MBT2552828.1 VanZ family protein [Arthrobacter sp. ISL-5]
MDELYKLTRKMRNFKLKISVPQAGARSFVSMGKWGQSNAESAARVLLAVYLVGLAVVAFWPTPVDRPVAGRLQTVLFALHQASLPQLINYNFVEFASNILMFAPIGALATLAFPAFHRGRIVLAAFLVSCGMELGQLLFLHDRVPSAMDIVANTSGAMLGIWVLGVLEDWLRRADFDKLNQWGSRG